MQLHERLMDLLGHEVAVTAQVENGVKEIAAGSLKEVGPDYLIVGATRQVPKGDVRGGADWWIRTAMVVAVVHGAGCARCLASD